MTGFWRLWTASGLSNLADGVYKVALPLIALTTTRDPILVAGVSTALTLPWLLLALPVGALVDRHDRRRLMLLANVVRATALVLTAGVLAGGLGSIWLLYVVAVLTGSAEVVYDTASQSILPQVVPRTELPRANSRIFAVELTANEFVGPPLGGLLVSVGVVVALLAPGAAWVVALGALLLLRGRYAATREGAQSVRADVVEGLRFLAGNRVLLTLGVMTGLFNLASSAVGAVLVLYAVGPESAMGLSEAGYGLLLTGTAVGSVLGSTVAAGVHRRLGDLPTLGGGMFLGLLFLGSPAASSSPYVVGAGYVIGGVGLMLWNVVAISMRQSVTPDELLGRTTGAHRLVAWGSRPLGALLGGVLAAHLGLRPVFAVMTAVVALTLLLLVPLRGRTSGPGGPTG